MTAAALDAAPSLPALDCESCAQARAEILLRRISEAQGYIQACRDELREAEGILRATAAGFRGPGCNGCPCDHYREVARNHSVNSDLSKTEANSSENNGNSLKGG